MIPLLVGEAPAREAPLEALGPGSASGRRILDLSGGRGYEALNLLPRPLERGERWPAVEAAEAARTVLRDSPAGRELALLGRRVARAFASVAPELRPLAEAPFFSCLRPRSWSLILWTCPHPSSTSRWWNCEMNRRRARYFFSEVLGTLPSDDRPGILARLADTHLLRRLRRWRRLRLLHRLRYLRERARVSRWEGFVERLCERMRADAGTAELDETGYRPSNGRRRAFRDIDLD